MSKTKKLEWFKFFPEEFSKGGIQFCTGEAVKLFMNLCGFYWRRECMLSKTEMYNTHCNSAFLLDELIHHEVIKLRKEKVIIEFLLEQRSGIIVSEKDPKYSERGKKGAEIRWKKPKYTSDVQPPLGPAPAVVPYDYTKLLNDETWMNTMCLLHGVKDHSALSEWLKEFEKWLIATEKSHINQSKYKEHFNNWMRKQEVKEGCPYSEEQIRQARNCKDSTGNVPSWFDKKYLKAL